MSNRIYIKPEILKATKKKNSSFSYNSFANTKSSNSIEKKHNQREDYSFKSEIERIKQKSEEYKNRIKEKGDIQSSNDIYKTSKYQPIEFISPLGGRSKKPKKVIDKKNFELEVKTKIKKSNNQLSKKLLIDTAKYSPKREDNNIKEVKDAVQNAPVKPEVKEPVAKKSNISSYDSFGNISKIDNLKSVSKVQSSNEYDYDLEPVKYDDKDYFFDDSYKIYESFLDKVNDTSLSQNDYLSRKTKLIESIRDVSSPFNYFKDEIGLVLSNNTKVFQPEIMPKLVQKEPELVKVDEDVKHYTDSIESEFLTARKNHRENKKRIEQFNNDIETEEIEQMQESSDAHMSNYSNISRAARANVASSENVTSQNKITKEMNRPKVTNQNYSLPAVNLLNPVNKSAQSNAGLSEKIEQLETFFKNFKIQAKVENSTIGPTVARFELSIAAGTKVSKISNLKDDIKLALASKDVRIEAPIPGKNLIGIEIPAMNSRTINIKELISSDKFKNSSKLEAALGLSIDNIPTFLDIASMPHGLISGSTGSGKSVSINALLVSLLYKNTPNDLRLILVDPKVVELSPYNGIPHLLSPVISDPKEALNSLKWAAQEMDRRYNLFAQTNTRNLDAYNKISEETLPKIVIVIDELADLMMVASNDVEVYITRIAQKSRAAGIHMILATQRPSVEVITGLIKANIPTRIAFAVSSSVDSRTILDQVGAESLLGRGDMLFSERGKSPIRLQAPYITDDEINNVISHWQNYRGDDSIDFNDSVETKSESSNKQKLDPELDSIAEFVISSQRASTSLIQRKFSFGYNKSARLIDQLEEIGVIGPQNGTKPREVYLTYDQYLEKRSDYEGN